MNVEQTRKEAEYNSICMLPYSPTTKPAGVMGLGLGATPDPGKGGSNERCQTGGVLDNEPVLSTLRYWIVCALRKEKEIQQKIPLQTHVFNIFSWKQGWFFHFC